MGFKMAKDQKLPCHDWYVVMGLSGFFVGPKATLTFVIGYRHLYLNNIS
jgi:hypothetical protein